MTRLTFTGIRNGRVVAITWEDGVLSGDLAACAWLEHLARVIDGHLFGPIGGPYVARDYLRNPYAARALILSIFPSGAFQEGELPPRVAPPGAIQ
jgi:hypothetical protein